MPPRRPPRLTGCQRKRQRPGNDPTVMKVLVQPGPRVLFEAFTQLAAPGACGGPEGYVRECVDCGGQVP